MFSSHHILGFINYQLLLNHHKMHQASTNSYISSFLSFTKLLVIWVTKNEVGITIFLIRIIMLTHIMLYQIKTG